MSTDESIQLERRALYNAIRLHWLIDPSIPVKEWQVQDYRKVPLENLFERLSELKLQLDRTTFLAFAQNCESPDDLMEDLVGERDLDQTASDLIYLHLFELWRRLVPEKRSLSIFCDELDYQIELYDQNQLDRTESLTDTLAELQKILDENVDQGAKPHDLFASISAGCANDIESFLYDFIVEQIEAENYSYAKELIEGFIGYILDTRWFEFLNARVLMSVDPEEASLLLEKLIRKTSSNADLEFNLEVLAFLVQDGERHLFIQLAKHTLPLLKVEDDFVELLLLTSDYFHCLDEEKQETVIKEILALRAHNKGDTPLEPKDPHLTQFKKLLHK